MNKRDKDYSWMLFLIIAVMFFWAAWLASSPDGKLHSALSIWAATFGGIAVLGLIINWFWDRTK